MRFKKIQLVLLLCLDLVYAQCDWTVLPVQGILSNIATATPFAYTFTDAQVSGCATAPTTIVGYYTAYVDGTIYTEQAPETHVLSVEPVVYGSFYFPQLIMTNLQRGQTITIFWTDYYTPAFTSSGFFYLTVAENAVVVSTSTPPATTATSSPQNTITTGPQVFLNPSTTEPTVLSTTSTKSSTSSSSSVPVGGIVGGVVGAVVAVSAIAAFTWYKVRTHGARRNIESGMGPSSLPPPPPPVIAQEKSPVPENMINETRYPDAAEDGPASGRLRYPEFS